MQGYKEKSGMRLITAGTEYQFELTFFRRRTRKILNDRIGNRKGFWPVLLGFSRHLSTLVLFSAFPVAGEQKTPSKWFRLFGLAAFQLPFRPIPNDAPDIKDAIEEVLRNSCRLFLAFSFRVNFAARNVNATTFRRQLRKSRTAVLVLRIQPKRQLRERFCR